MENVLKNFENIQFVEDPYPHVVIDNFLSQEHFEKLKASFPSEELFKQNKRLEFHGGRIDLQKGDPLMEKFLSQTPEWNELFSAINSPGFFDIFKKNWIPLINKFGGISDQDKAKMVDENDYEFIPPKPIRIVKRLIRDTGLRWVINKIKAVFEGNSYYIVYILGKSNKGYYVEPHTDNRYKSIVFLLYFDEIENGGQLIVHNSVQKDLPDYKRYPLDSELSHKATVKSMPNRLVGFINCNKAYHSTTPWTDGSRRHIYISIAKKNHESMWKESSPSLGDTPPNYLNIFQQVTKMLLAKLPF